MKKINLRFGGGEVDVLIDLRQATPPTWPKLAPFGGSAALHARFGGQTYYTSRSGRSGAGFVEAKPWLRRCETYRTDVRVPSFPCDAELRRTVGGWGMWVPTAGLEVDYGAACVVWNADAACLNLVHPGEMPDLEAPLEIFSLVAWVGDQWRTEEVQIRLPPKDIRPRNWARVIKAWLRDTRGLEFEYPAGYSNNPFWSRLGWCLADGQIHVVRQRLCEHLIAADCDDLDTLQDAAPRGVTFLAPRCYVVEEVDRQYVALLGDDGIEVEHPLDTATLVEALAGRPEAAIAVATEALRVKREALAEHAARVAAANLSAAERRAKAEAFIAADPARLIGVRDSVAAGNCEAGTMEYARTVLGVDWPTPDATVRADKLLGHLDDERVMRVVESLALSTSS